ncbi:MAG: hypothetical protein OEV66_03370 [Spirochaetia bacterium]|nr:hypothetical protein [Spirochaetia bacterium]
MKKLQDYGLWFVFSATIIFFYSISSANQKIQFFSAILKTNSLNACLFYFWKEPLFLDFSFQGIHPSYLFLSFFSGFLPAGTMKVFIFADFIVLFYFALRLKVLNFYTYILWLTTCSFLFRYNATILLLWFQFGIVLIYDKIIQTKKINFLLADILFFVFLSGVYLPGLAMIFIYQVLRHTIKSKEIRYFYRGLFNQTAPYFGAFVVLLILHLILAKSYFGVPNSCLLKYLFLPVTIFETKSAVNNENFSEALFNNLNENFIVYIVLFCAVLIWALLLRDRNIRVKLFFIGLMFAAGLLFTRGESLFYPFAGFFLLHESHAPVIAGFNRKIMIILAALLLTFFSLLRSSGARETKVEANDENILISFNDLQNLNFQGAGSRKIKNMIIIDLKIIPQNVQKLIEQKKIGKIDILLNEQTIAFLKKDSGYEKKVMPMILEYNYSLYLKSSIHPDQEKWPYRRAYLIWQMIRKKNPDARLVLF